MADQLAAAVDRTIATDGPHCGVCLHASFEGDPGRTPYCTHHEETRSIRVGEACDAFAPVRDGDVLGTTDEGASIEVDTTERTSGTAAPFYAAYRDGERYGVACGRCLALDVAVDPMGRIECNGCGNASKPTEWDAAYL